MKHDAANWSDAPLRGKARDDSVPDDKNVEVTGPYDAEAGATFKGYDGVGWTVKVHWPLMKAWYTAVVLEYSPKSQMHLVKYTKDKKSKQEPLDLVGPDKAEWLSPPGAPAPAAAPETAGSKSGFIGKCECGYETSHGPALASHQKRCQQATTIAAAPAPPAAAAAPPPPPPPSAAAARAAAPAPDPSDEDLATEVMIEEMPGAVYGAPTDWMVYLRPRREGRGQEKGFVPPLRGGKQGKRSRSLAEIKRYLDTLTKTELTKPERQWLAERGAPGEMGGDPSKGLHGGFGHPKHPTTHSIYSREYGCGRCRMAKNGCAKCNPERSKNLDNKAGVDEAPPPAMQEAATAGPAKKKAKTEARPELLVIRCGTLTGLFSPFKFYAATEAA